MNSLAIIAASTAILVAGCSASTTPKSGCGRILEGSIISKSIEPAEDYILNGTPTHQNQRFVLMIDNNSCINLMYVDESTYDQAKEGSWYVSRR